MRSSMRRSTPAMGEGTQSRSAPCITARREKSALRSMTALRSSGNDARPRGDPTAPGGEGHEPGRLFDFDEIGKCLVPEVIDIEHGRMAPGEMLVRVR